MSDILPSTLIQQQSFAPDWILKNGSSIIPTGIITACQITTTSTAPVFLQELSYGDNSLHIVFMQNGVLCAYGTLSSTNESNIVALNVDNYCLSATVELGSIPMNYKTYTNIGAEINPSYIRVVRNPDTKNSPRKLTIIQDDLNTTVDITQNIEVKLSDNLKGEYIDVDNKLSISMSEEDYLDYTELGNTVIKTDTRLNTINGVKPKAGKVTINIYNNGKLLPVSNIADNWLELDGSDIPFCPSFVDVIDNYIAPTTHIGYLPLDDMYDDNNGIPVRNTEKAEEWIYGNMNNTSGVGLTDIDTQVDIEE